MSLPKDPVVSSGGTVITPTDMLLARAEQIIEWHDKICAKRAERDTVRRNAPQRVELHPGFAGA